MVSLTLKDGQQIALAPGEHSSLIKSIVEDFGARYAPGGLLVYIGDTRDKHAYFDEELLSGLEVTLGNHGKMPDVVIHLAEKNWLLLIEAVTSHGPVDSKRQGELGTLFEPCGAEIVYVSAFPDRHVFLKHAGVIAWKSEVWLADAPDHLIHFNGRRFLGPHEK